MAKRRYKRRSKSKFSILIMLLMLAFFGFKEYCLKDINKPKVNIETNEHYEQLSSLKFEGSAYTIINNNVPFFNEEYPEAFEEYSDLDCLGRCGAAFVIISQDTLPDEERGSISEVKPSGWHTYNSNTLFNQKLIDNTQYVYNRCHLIAFSLAVENANKLNLITGTRYMNTNMIDFETEVLNYVRLTGNRVLYRVTPIFEGDNLLANGVLMEAK